MTLVYAFLIGGIICALAQFVLDLFKLTPGQITAVFVIIGATLEFFNLYDKLIDFASSGATLPITSFGHSLAHSSYEAMQNGSYLDGLKGMLSGVSGGISLAIILSLVAALIFKPKD